MELLIIISSILRRYHFVLAEPDKPVSAHVHVAGFLTDPTSALSLPPGKDSFASRWGAVWESSADKSKGRVV